MLPGSRDGAGQQRRWPSVRARATAQCQVGVLAAHEQTARPPASECLARSRQYSPSVLHVSYRPRRDWELGSHARLPHTEPYILFVIIFEPLIEPGSQLLARSSSTTPCPPARICLALPRLAEPGPPLAAAAVNTVQQLSAVWASASCAVCMQCACGVHAVYMCMGNSRVEVDDAAASTRPGLRKQQQQTINDRFFVACGGVIRR